MFSSWNRLFITLPAITLLQITTFANALGCYGAGLTYTDMTSTDPSLLALARGYACDRFQGAFTKDAMKYFCVQIAKNKIEFEVWNKAGTTQTLTRDACMDVFTKEMGACDDGSEQKYGNFHYRNDPNAGRCMNSGGNVIM